MPEPTELLLAWQQGDEAARNSLFELLYQDLRRVAGRVMSGDGNNISLQPTELLNEAFFRLFGLERLNWADRNHFMAVAATTMRQVLLDQYRRRAANKRAGQDVTLITRNMASDAGVDLLELDEALSLLAEISADLARVVEMKFFAGMTNEEIASALDTSPSTVKRSWRTAKAWLADHMADDTGEQFR